MYCARSEISFWSTVAFQIGAHLAAGDDVDMPDGLEI
jgi:hypothetical protein